MRFISLLLCCCCFLIPAGVAAQLPESTFRLLQQLDSLAATTNPAADFAALYRETTIEAIRQTTHAGPAEKHFIEAFETAFANLFLTAAGAPEVTRSAVWVPVFSNAGLTPEKRLLLGINAHVNGDLWQALAFRFSAAELRTNKTVFIRYQQALSRIVDRYYPEIKRKLPLLRAAHLLTAGRIRNAAEALFFSWRKAQYRLAILYHGQPRKFRKTVSRICRKKERLDQFILRHL